VDGWAAFWTIGGADQVVGLLNLNNTSQVYFTSQYSNALWGGMVHGTVCVTPGIDTVTGYRYIIRATQGLTGAFGFEGVETLGFCTSALCGGLGSSIVRLNNWPILSSAVQFPASGSQIPAITYPPFHCTDATFITGLCHIGAHGAYVAVNGRQFVNLNFDTGSYFQGWIGMFLIASGDLMGVPAEAGGGLYAQFPIWGFSDTHGVCSSSIPICTFNTDSDLVQTPGVITPSFLVTNGTTASPIVVTSSPNYSGMNGDSLLFGGVKGLTGLNGVSTVGGLSGATFNAGGTTGGGTYTAGTGMFTLNAKPPAAPYQNEIIQFDYTHLLDVSPTYKVTRINKARAEGYNDSYVDSAYYLQVHVNCNPAQTLCSYNSNMGFPDSMGVFMVNTGSSPPPPGNLSTLRSTTVRGTTVH
jgi:hypothetical protein